MKVWAIGKRNLKEIYRNPVLLGFLLGMPVAFMLVFVAAAGGQQAGAIALSRGLSLLQENPDSESQRGVKYPNEATNEKPHPC